MSEWASQKYEQFQKLYGDAVKKYEEQVAALEEHVKNFPGFEDTEIGKKRRDSLNKFGTQVETWRKQIETAGKRVEEITVHKKTWESKQGDYKALQTQTADIQKAAADSGGDFGKSISELVKKIEEIDIKSKAEDFKEAVEKLDHASEFAKDLWDRMKKSVTPKDEKQLDPKDLKQIQDDIALIRRGFKVFEDAGGKVPNWITGPISVLKNAVDASVDLLDAIEKASAALRKYNDAALKDAEELPDKPLTMDEFHQQGVDMATRDRQWLANNVKFTLGWKNPESVTSHFVKNTVERYAPKMIADNWDKIAKTLR